MNRRKKPFGKANLYQALQKNWRIMERCEREMTMLEFCVELLRMIPKKEKALTDQIWNTMRLAVDERGHTRFSGFQLNNQLRHRFGSRPRSALGKAIKEFYLTTRIIDDEKFAGYKK